MMKYLLPFTFLVCIPFLSIAQNNTSDKALAELDQFYQPVKWRNIGPFRGGRSVCASGVVGDPTTYYMGTTGGGVWKTQDAGHHWQNISDGYFGTGSVGAVAVSESDPNVVYVGMGEHAPRGVMTSHGDGVYKSTDAGKTWTKLGLSETQHIARIVIHPKNPEVVYVAAQGALHGNNEERGIYKSTDGGATWEKIHKGLPKELGKMAVSVSRANPDKVYALIESDSDKEQGGLFVSSDAGTSSNFLN